MLQPDDRRAMLGYVIDDSIQVGDMCWQGPLKLVRGQMAGALFTSADKDVCVIPDVPNLAHIARFLAEHPETVDALGRLSNGIANVPVSGSQTMFRRDVDMFTGLVKAMRGEGGHE